MTWKRIYVYTDTRTSVYLCRLYVYVYAYIQFICENKQFVVSRRKRKPSELGRRILEHFTVSSINSYVRLTDGLSGDASQLSIVVARYLSAQCFH